MMKKASSGLAAFTRSSSSSKIAEQELQSQPRRRKRGTGDVVSLTLRLPRSDWQRVHQLAVAESTSIQQLAVDGLSKIFADRGLPPLSSSS